MDAVGGVLTPRGPFSPGLQRFFVGDEMWRFPHRAGSRRSNKHDEPADLTAR